MLTFGNLILVLVVPLSVIFIASSLYFTRNFKFWQKLDIPYVKPTPFVGNLKDCAFQKLSIDKHLQQIYEQHSDKPYVGIFSFDKPILLVRDLQLVKNITDRVISFDEKLDPLGSKGLFEMKGQLWLHWRTNLTSAFTSGRKKMTFYLVDTCGKELADCLDSTSVYGK